MNCCDVYLHMNQVSSVYWQNDLLLTSSWDSCVKVSDATYSP